MIDIQLTVGYNVANSERTEGVNTMTQEAKKAWLEKASIDELLYQYVSLIQANHYGVNNNDDIKLTRDEIARRAGE